MCAELGYQFLLSDSALLCVVKATLENAYLKIRGQMPVTAEVLPHRKRTVLPGDCRAVFIHPLSWRLHGLPNVPCLGSAALSEGQC